MTREHTDQTDHFIAIAYMYMVRVHVYISDTIFAGACEATWECERSGECAVAAHC